MKTIFTLIAIMSFCLSLNAQAPQQFKYQAVARDISGNILPDQNVAFRISILEGAVGGTALFVETHNTTTNGFGLISLSIGAGINVSGSIAAIDWSANIYFLAVEMDPSGGTAYVDMGTSQLLSVPYALSAKTAENVDELIALIEELQLKTGIKVKDCDGNIYKTVTIGDQVWMAENLRTSIYCDNSPIPNVEDPESWAGLDSGAFCWNDNDSATYEIPYGKLYNWYVIESANICPEGWHVATDADYSELITFLGTSPGAKMKEVGTEHWNSSNTGATNESGFTGLPGMRSDAGEFHADPGKHGLIWTATETDAIGYVWIRRLDSYDSTVDRYGSLKRDGAFIRCVKD